MTQVRTVARVLYQFVVGDDWKPAAGVLLSLVIGWVLLTMSFPGQVVVMVTGAVVILTFVASLAVDGGRRR